MNFWQAVSSGFSNYVNFSGRAFRSEFWFFYLFLVIVSAAAALLDWGILDYPNTGPIETIWNLVTILPSLAVSVRRLHDIDRTGWWMLLLLTGIGVFVLLYFFCIGGTPGPNRFGPDRLGGRVITPPEAT